MCGIFGIVSNNAIDYNKLRILAKLSQQRGSDSSGLVTISNSTLSTYKSDLSISSLLSRIKFDSNVNVAVGHTRLVTNGLQDNQPVQRDNCFVFHNGIITNYKQIWQQIPQQRYFEIDSEIIAALMINHLSDSTNDLTSFANNVLNVCKGSISSASLSTKLKALVLFSNTGSLYFSKVDDSTYFASESFILSQIGCTNISQITTANPLQLPLFADGKITINPPTIIKSERTKEFISDIELLNSSPFEKLLKYKTMSGRRCTKCILPETMPYISFDDKGVCNYCNNYKLRNKPKPLSEFQDLLEKFRTTDSSAECIVPFSGGRDSSYGLHFITKVLGLKAIAYTYDWGMVTDLGRRNISLMCSELNVENIIVAANINRKRKYIAKNLAAWLNKPHLGMISILTAGDKHFFRYLHDVQRQTNISLNLWGVNPLEITHFKSGFLGIQPSFNSKLVYSQGLRNQFDYQSKRFKAMLRSPGYFNSSIFDTLLGEYYRTFKPKNDYYHLFDYWRWDENQIDTTLNDYGWETATDTPTTWRIGDATAAFYNYIYYSVAGFTEHDTFRSNQIREGDITRDEALRLVNAENRPRFSNIKWYLDTLNFDFESTINIINNIPTLHPSLA